MIRSESIHFFESIGCKFVALNGKKAADPNWQRRPLSADEISVWRGNIGVIAGQVSGGICWLDVDHDAELFLYRYPFLATSLVVGCVDRDDHCKIAVRLSRTNSYYVRSGNKIGLTVLGDGFYAAVIGTHPCSAEYEHNSQQPISLSAIEMTAIENDWSHILKSGPIGKS